jgi:hypothetical protein
MTSTTRPFSVIWMCETCIPSGRENKDDPSIMTSFLLMKDAFRRDSITVSQ